MHHKAGPLSRKPLWVNGEIPRIGRSKKSQRGFEKIVQEATRDISPLKNLNFVWRFSINRDCYTTQKQTVKQSNVMVITEFKFVAY